MKRLTPAAVVAAVLGSMAPLAAGAGTDGATASPPTAPASTSIAAPRFGTWGFDAAGMDRTAKPGDSFYRFAGGVAVDKMEIPADRTNWGSFTALSKLSEERVRALIEEMASKPGASGDEARIGAFFKAFLDEARVEQLDATPLAADLQAIRDARTHADVARLQGAAAAGFGRAFFGAFVNEDAKRPGVNVLYLNQSGLGLPDRDYYLVARFAAQKAAYQTYVADLLRMAGWPEPETRAVDIVALETRIAEASWTRAESRDRDKTYNPVGRDELRSLAPAYPWVDFLGGAGLQGADRAVVSQNTAFPKIAEIFAATPIPNLQAWQAFHLVDQAAPLLSKRFVDRHFEFRQKTLAGTPEQRPRVERAVVATNDALGEPLGRFYVARYFTPESKAKMEALVADLKQALAARIDRLEWMGPETKRQAQGKLAKFEVNIGYSPLVRDYAGLRVDAADLYGNARRSAAFEWAWNTSRLTRPADPADWGRPPQTVNAWYRSTHNDITFPAAILQPPFFDPGADPAINYGAIGGVIGHEISHGFDDQGRKSDGDGVLRDWWTEEDATKFKAQATRLGAQYDSYGPLPADPAVKVNGQLTMGENIGDLGGLLLALDAYRVSLAGKPAPVIDGLTGEQRVFLGWAQVWRAKARDEFLRQMVVTNPHSPPQFRVDGVVRNVDAWYDAFGVKPGDALYLAPAERVRIW
jgi:putative endopeptidase